MPQRRIGHVVCHVTKHKIPFAEAVPAPLVRNGVAKLIQADFPDWDDSRYISHQALKRYRKAYIAQMIEASSGELSKLDREVVESMSENETLVQNMETQFDRQLTFGERLSDRIADFGGSWTFIMAFGSFLILWILVNVYVIVNRPFDPYPFILLNLILSCLAAIQAPVIMMSQNRKEDRDRLRAEYDYKVNLKAEIEIRTLHEKIDSLMRHQWERLLEIQQMQLDFMEDLPIRRVRKKAEKR